MFGKEFGNVNQLALAPQATFLCPPPGTTQQRLLTLSAAAGHRDAVASYLSATYSTIVHRAAALRTATQRDVKCAPILHATF